MRPLIALTALTVLVNAGLFAAEPPRPPQGPLPFETSCFTCHQEFEGEPTQLAKDDVHFSKGLSCHNCHGGDPVAGADGDMDAAHDVSKGFRGRPSRREIPEYCARCHSDATYMKGFNPHARVDQLSEYRTSMHGRRHSQGDDRVAVCSDCHGAHGIRAVSDPRAPVYPTRVAETCGRCHNDSALMSEYGIAPGQIAEYRRSVHAHALYEQGDISAPTCDDCHGSHGAAPPGVESIANVCGSCHGREASLFRETEMSRSLDLDTCIQCMVCHSNHAVLPPNDGMLGVGPGSTCTGCHVEGEPQYDAAAQMGETVQLLTSRLGEAHELLDKAERAGVEVGPDKFELQKAQDRLIESRVLVHSFDLDRFMEAAEDGLAVAGAGIDAGQQAFAELRVRRVGLGLSLFIILGVIVALTMTIRAIEKEASD